MKYVLEICVGSLESALAAEKGGADRIELCDNLYEGGTTPSFGMIKTCLSLLSIPVFPIIRPRGGDFIYSEEEFEVMKSDVIACRELGCEGLVFGILQSDGKVDKERCSELVKLSGPMQLTFHRAFDRCSDREEGLEEIIAMGFRRVLTSGGNDFAEQGVSELIKLVKQAKDRISIMPGSGITAENLLQIARETGAIELHTTAKSKTQLMPANHQQNNLDSQYLFQTDMAKVAEMCRILSNL